MQTGHCRFFSKTGDRNGGIVLFRVGHCGLRLSHYILFPERKPEKEETLEKSHSPSCALAAADNDQDLSLDARAPDSIL
jgi:hypothetical protein